MLRPYTLACGPPAYRRTIDGKKKTNEKSGWRKDNVPFDVGPGSKMLFELGQVGHCDLIFVRWGGSGEVKVWYLVSCLDSLESGVLTRLGIPDSNE